MKLEQQLTSLELSKKLKELGVKQDSLWYFVKDDNEGFERYVQIDDFIHEWDTDSEYGQSIPTIHDVLEDEKWSDWKKDESILIVSAFTVAELGEMLPREIIHQKETNLVEPVPYRIIYEKRNDIGHTVRYPNFTIFLGDTPFMDDLANFTDVTEANARAKMIIYLLENHLMTVK